MEKFAGYGFNKSHAAAYSLLAYHTAWIKVHHTAEFFAANMTIEMDDTDKLKVLLNDAKPSASLRAARRQPQGDLPLRAAVQEEADPLWPGRRQGHGARRHGGHRGGARRPAGRSTACSTSAPGSTASGQQARGRGADQGRRLRCAACRPRQPAGQRGPGLRLGRALQEANATRAGCSTSDDPRLRAAGARLLARPAWSMRERLTLEKTAIGFFLSGHLFDEMPTRCAASASAARRSGDRRASRSCWPASSATCA
jgi:DNA polymerase-3 subunit alpha